MVQLKDGRMFDNEEFEKAAENMGYKVMNGPIDVVKNGHEMTAVTMCFNPTDKDPQDFIAYPNFILERYPDSMLSDHKSLLNEMKRLAEEQEDQEPEMSKAISDLTSLSKEEFLKKVYVVVQQRSNENIIKRKYSDLDAVIKYDVLPNASMKVTEEIAKRLNVNIDELWDNAEKNTFTDTTISIRSMKDVLLDMYTSQGAPDEIIQQIIEQMDANPSMYIISNKTGIHGFTQVFNHVAIQEWMNNNGISDMYVIPSSIHEAIALPIDDSSKDFNHIVIDNMINEVNTTQLKPEDVLSSHVYYIEAQDGIVRSSCPW